MSNKSLLITDTTKFFCIIGYPVEDSFSPMMHNTNFKELGLDYVYVAFDILN